MYTIYCAGAVAAAGTHLRESALGRLQLQVRYLSAAVTLLRCRRRDAQQTTGSRHQGHRLRSCWWRYVRVMHSTLGGGEGGWGWVRVGGWGGGESCPSCSRLFLMRLCVGGEGGYFVLPPFYNFSSLSCLVGVYLATAQPSQPQPPSSLPFVFLMLLCLLWRPTFRRTLDMPCGCKWLVINLLVTHMYYPMAII